MARLGSGIAAGMAYPTTLALITALWQRPGKDQAIALWSSGRRRRSRPRVLAVRGPAGAISVGLGVPRLALPFAARRAGARRLLVPAHVNETTDPVDNLGGSLVMVADRLAGAGDQYRPAVPNAGALAGGLEYSALVSELALFVASGGGGTAFDLRSRPGGSSGSGMRGHWSCSAP